MRNLPRAIRAEVKRHGISTCVGSSPMPRIGLVAAIALLTACTLPAGSAGGTQNEPARAAGLADVERNNNAQSAAHTPVGAVSTPSQAPQNCGNTTLTADGFADRFYAIASHGTLLDIPFIEQTLNVQFTTRAVTEGGVVNVQRKAYHATSIMGAPISVDLDISEPSNQYILGMLRFDISAFATCLKLTSLTLSSRFQGRFVPAVFPGSSVDRGNSIVIPGTAGSKIQAGYSYRITDQFVTVASIQHLP